MPDDDDDDVDDDDEGSNKGDGVKDTHDDKQVETNSDLNKYDTTEKGKAKPDLHDQNYSNTRDETWSNVFNCDHQLSLTFYWVVHTDLE